MFGLISFHYIPMGHCVPMEIISLLLPPKVTKTLKIANVWWKLLVQPIFGRVSVGQGMVYPQKLRYPLVMSK
jgi:hypothetical protein